MRLLLDTNAVSDLFDDDERILVLLRKATRVYASPIMVAEILGGAAKLGKRSKGYRHWVGKLDRLLANELVRDLPITTATAAVLEVCVTALRRTPIPTHDAWLVAQAVEHDCFLVSRDKRHMALAKTVLKGRLRWIHHHA